MDASLQSVKQQLEFLRQLSIAEMNQEAVAEHLYAISTALNAIRSLSATLVAEIKLNDYLDVFIKICYAGISASAANGNGDECATSANYMGVVKRQALKVLCGTLYLSPTACSLFYRKSVVLYLLSILSGYFCKPEEGELQQLNYVDAQNCIAAMLIAVHHEPRVCEQLRQHFASEVVSKFFTNEKDSLALDAVALCAYITSDPTGKELRIPDRILLYLLHELKRRLLGLEFQKNDNRVLASGLLLRLQSLILCSDDFNKRVMGYRVLDVLATVLAAPEPPDAADADLYWHSQAPVEDESEETAFTKMEFSTFLEKERAARVCWALLLSERRFRKNAHEMRKHKDLLTALKSAGERSKQVQTVTDGVLWQLKRRQAANKTQPETAIDEAKRDAGPEPRLHREKIASAKLRKTVTISIPSQLTQHNVDNTLTLTGRHKSTSTLSADLKFSHQHHESNANTEAQQVLTPKLQMAHETTESNAESVKPQVMISYTSHCKPQLVARINKALQKAGLSTWIYTEKMSGDMYTAMAKAIEQSAVVLVCYSNAYYNSDPCHSEFNYARYCKKPIVLVRLEDFTPFGWLGISVAGMMYHDFSSIDRVGDDFKTRVSKLATELSTYLTKTDADQPS